MISPRCFVIRCKQMSSAPPGAPPPQGQPLPPGWLEMKTQDGRNATYYLSDGLTMVLSWGFICCSDRSRIVDAPDVPDTLVVLNLSLHQSGDERELLDETCFRTPAICEARTRVSGMRVVTAGSGPSSWATRKFCASGGSSARRGAGAVRARPHVCCPARSWRQRAEVHQGQSGRVASLRMHSPS